MRFCTFHMPQVNDLRFRWQPWISERRNKL
jgi:hypothetical protein